LSHHYFDLVHFAETVALRSCRTLLPLVGLSPIVVDAFRDRWRQLLDRSYDFPDFIVDPRSYDREARTLVAEMDLASGDYCATRSFSCGFESELPWSSEVDPWADALMRFAALGIGAAERGPALDVWADYGVRENAVAVAQASISDVWDANLVSKWAAPSAGLGATPFDMVRRAILRVDVCRAVVELQRMGRLETMVKGANLDEAHAPAIAPCGEAVSGRPI